MLHRRRGRRFNEPSRREQLQTRIAYHEALAPSIEDPEKRSRAERFADALKEELGAMRAPRIRRTVDDKPVVPTEHQEQVKVIQWWALACHGYKIPEYALFAVPNGGARDIITAARLKAEGARRGALDLILAYPTAASHGLFIEMKRQDGSPSDVKPDQRAYLEYLQSVGYAASVHWSGDSAIEAIKAYLAPA